LAYSADRALLNKLNGNEMVGQSVRQTDR